MTAPISWRFVMDRVIGILQQKYGRTKEQAQREVNENWKDDEKERKVS